MELTAVAEALESLKRPCTVTLISDSNYVVRGMTEWVQNWIANDWQTSKKRPVKHADIIIFDLASGDVDQIWDDHTDRVNTLAISPDGALLASAGHDQTVLVWDLASGAVQNRFEGHTRPIESLVFIADNVLASGARDTTIRLWHKILT